ncbi:hypothetical protein ACQEV4_42600 [Streptomyces shenzhenensis]|uniref:hypothetical protein n=1 Tax=Streptomyces shenzhenensis TaxID=943815 RepID=UPI003D9107BC
MTRVRGGYVAEAAITALAAQLSVEVPRLDQDEIRRIAELQAAALDRSGARITVPAAAFAASVRRVKNARRLTP